MTGEKNQIFQYLAGGNAKRHNPYEGKFGNAQKNWYSGKKKKHSLKTQVIFHPHSHQIIGIEIGTGREHDISVAKRTVKKMIHYKYIMVDLGYYGLKEIGFKTIMPIKKPKGFDLIKEEKAFNQMISGYRVVIEHINRQLKTFRILSERYRNRRKRFGLRVNLISGIVNKINNLRLSQ